MELSLAQTDDAYRRELETDVLDCHSLDDGWAVELAETIFYPEGGGQPADRGTIGDIEVRDVQRTDAGRILHLTDEPVEEGDVSIAIDEARRFDHMQQHTAQHLITAIADDEMGWPTVSFRLGSEDSTIDLDATGLDDSDLERLQARVNAEIRNARPVDFRFVDESSYRNLETRSETLPDAGLDDVRIVEIEGLDRDACGGTHVANTTELQAVAWTDLEETRGRTRLHYLAGGRVLDRLEGCLERESALDELLSCGRDDHLAAVESTLETARAAERRADRMQEELAEVLGARLADADTSVAELHRDEPDFDFLNAIARAAESRDSSQTILLTASEPGEARRGIFLVSGPESVVDDAGDEVAEILEGRGGGPPGMYQGKADDVTRRDEAIERLRDVVS